MIEIKQSQLLPFTVKYSLIRVGYHFRNGRLTWNNAIPENEVHIKLGGDSGGWSFKMAFQIANLRHSSSNTNTVVFAMFHAKDGWANFKTA